MNLSLRVRSGACRSPPGLVQRCEPTGGTAGRKRVDGRGSKRADRRPAARGEATARPVNGLRLYRLQRMSATQCGVTARSARSRNAGSAVWIEGMPGTVGGRSRLVKLDQYADAPGFLIVTWAMPGRDRRVLGLGPSRARA